jgi:uncharacterized protein (TIGR02246 family)
MGNSSVEGQTGAVGDGFIKPCDRHPAYLPNGIGDRHRLADGEACEGRHSGLIETQRNATMKMKTCAIAAFLLLGAPLAQALETTPFVYSTVAEQPQNVNDREIAGLFDRWNAALKTGSAVAVTSLYAPDAILQPTVSNKVRSTPAQIQDYFVHFLAAKPVGVINYREIRHLGPDAAMDSGVYTFTLTQADGSKREVQARYTFLYERLDGQWKIINHHSSAMPEVPKTLQASH